MPTAQPLRRGGRVAIEAVLADIEERFGLDDPVYVQYGRYVWNLLQGDLGYSYQTEEPVRDAIAADMRTEGARWRVLDLALKGIEHRPRGVLVIRLHGGAL